MEHPAPLSPHPPGADAIFRPGEAIRNIRMMSSPNLGIGRLLNVCTTAHLRYARRGCSLRRRDVSPPLPGDNRPTSTITTTGMDAELEPKMRGPRRHRPAGRRTLGGNLVASADPLRAQTSTGRSATGPLRGGTVGGAARAPALGAAGWRDAPGKPPRERATSGEASLRT